jgi:predicted nucleic acid-binding protein
MILMDTSVWVDHVRRSDAVLAAALNANVVAIHPFVIGELACGLPCAPSPSHGMIYSY